MDIKEKFLTGEFKELCQSVFEQKIDSDSKGSFTVVLCEDEECFAVEQMLKGNTKMLYFLQKYQRHYPLSNKAVDMLIKNIACDNALQLLLQNFKLYGYNRTQGYAICKTAEALDSEFLYQFCLSARIFDQDLYNRLSLIRVDKFKEISDKKKISADNWGELYKESSQKYFEKK